MESSNGKIYRILFMITTIIGLVNVILVFVWTSRYLGGFSWQSDPLHQFNYHPVCAVVGLIFLYGKGLLLYRTLPHKTKYILKLFHTITMLMVFVLTVISLKCVFDSHDYRLVPIPNLYSLHSWIGLGTVILFAAQFVCGFLILLFPGLKYFYRKQYLPYHQFWGIIIFLLAVISCHSGIMEKVKGSLGKDYLSLPPSALVANFLGVSIVIFAILIIYLALMPQFKRRPLPEENVCIELDASA